MNRRNGSAYFGSLLVGLVLLLGSGVVSATQLEINAVGVDGGAQGSGPGSSRGIAFSVDSAFSIDSVGLYSDIGSTSYDVTVYSSTDGNQLGAVLASVTGTVGGLGLQWYDIAIDFAFNAGSFYAIEWATTSGGVIPGGAGSYFHYGNDSNLPLTAGPVTLINGFAGSSFSNSLHPRLRVDVLASVPAPVTVALMGLGIVGLGYARRRKAA